MPFTSRQEMVFTIDFWWFIILSISGYFVFAFLYYLKRLERVSPKNKAVLITGCDSGFGYKLALRLSGMGYQVFAGCLFPEGDAAKSLATTPGVDVVELDVTSEESISAAAKATSEKLGENVLWAVVNNAGIPQLGEMEWCPMEMLLKVFDVNTFGLVRVTKKFLPLIKMSKGRIVNVTSVSANRRLLAATGYSMSKAAARVFSNATRLEFRKWGIQVVEVAPYFYSTPLVQKDRVTKLLKQSWDRSDQEVTSSLGEEYFKKYLDLAHRFLKILCIPRLEEVVDCMEEAVASVSPKLLYEPGNFINFILLDTILYLPAFLQDFIFSLLLPKLK